MAPRALFSRLPSLLAIPFLLSLAPAISAQDTALKTVSQPPVATLPMATPAAKNKETSARAKARIEQKKALSISLLVSLANDARNYQDQKLRARTLSRIADALWEPERYGKFATSRLVESRLLSIREVSDVSRCPRLVGCLLLIGVENAFSPFRSESEARVAHSDAPEVVTKWRTGMEPA